MEEEDITEVMERMVIDFAKQKERRDEACEYDQREFGLWVASVKPPQSAMKAFREFEYRFAQLLDRDRRSVGSYFF